MGKEKIKLKIITHEKVVFEKEVDEITLQGTKGRFGVLPNHINIVSALDIGITKAVIVGKPTFITTMGGIFKFNNNVATILTDTAEMGSDVDIVRARTKKEQIEARLKAHNMTPDEFNRAQISLAKAITRLKAGERSA